MAKRPAEIFAYPIQDDCVDAQKARKGRRCPFAGKRCNKQSRLIRYPMGVCSVQYGKETIGLCPRRFLQDNVVFSDIADHYFGDRNDLLVFSEVNLPDVGNFDYVMVKHRPLSTDIQDFIVIEFQTGQTTSTGKLVEALKDFMKGEQIEGKSYGFGLNLADIWKRSFTQILNKGIVLERWGHRIYWVVQEPVYQNLLDRYGLNGMGYRDGDKTVFRIYDLQTNSRAGQYQLCHTRTESASIDHLFDAFRNKAEIPSKDKFVEKLRGKLEAKAAIALRFERNSNK